MNRFFAESGCIDESTNTVTITGADVNHIRNVLRLKPGDEILVNDREGTAYVCNITEVTSGHVLCEVAFRKNSDTELSSKIYLFQGLPKADKMELIIQKCVELGAYEIVPVANDRCVMKLSDDAKAANKIKRWNAISEGAAKQSGRGIVPKVTAPMSMKEAFAYAGEQGIDVLLFPYEQAEGMKATAEAFRRVKPGSSVGIFIGPEGGFSQKEVELALEKGAAVLSLGKRILRTETAGLCIISCLMMQLEMESDQS